MTQSLTLTPDHKYYHGERRLVSVSEVLDDSGLRDVSYYKSTNLVLGEMVHRMMALYELNRLNEDTLDPELRPYLDSWKKVEAVIPFICDDTEVMLSDLIHGFAGRPDWIGARCYLEDHDSCHCVIDWKTGAKQRWHDYQLAAYSQLVYGLAGAWPLRIAVYLQSDGRMARLEERTDQNDLRIFLAAVAVTNQKRIDRGE